MPPNDGQATAPIQDNVKEIEISSDSNEIADILGEIPSSDDGTPIESGVDSLKGILSDDELKSINEAVGNEDYNSEDEEDETLETPDEEHYEVDEDVNELLNDIEETLGEDELDDDEESGTVLQDGEGDDDQESREMMHADYTKKTMALAEDRKAFEAETQQANSDLNAVITDLETKYQGMDEQLKTKETWDFAIDNMKVEDPELYQEVQDYYKSVHKFASNPIVDRQTKRLEAIESRLESKEQSREDDTIRAQYNQEKTNLQSKYASQFKKLNFTPSWDKVQQEYINGAATVEKALHAAHGAEIFKLSESRGKVDLTKRNAKNSKRVINPDNATKFKNLSRGKTLKETSYNTLVDMFSSD